MKKSLSFLFIGTCTLLLLLLTFIISQPVTRATRRSVCREVACELEKQTRIALEEAAMRQTADAIPTFTPLPTRTATPEGWRDNPTPIPTMAIRHLSGDFRENPSFHDANDVWLIGSAPSTDGKALYGVFIYASPPDHGTSAEFAIITFGSVVAPEKYTSVWTAPRDIGAIIITNATGIDGILSFTTSTGVIGTFDLASQTWTFQ